MFSPVIAVPWVHAGHGAELVSPPPVRSGIGRLIGIPRSFSVDDIKRTLLAMSFVKMSMFHWHIVDSQSFPSWSTPFRNWRRPAHTHPRRCTHRKTCKILLPMLRR